MTKVQEALVRLGVPLCVECARVVEYAGNLWCDECGQLATAAEYPEVVDNALYILRCSILQREEPK